ncbi:MAG: diaminopimelate decarboxylase [Propionibacteriales bacterium]|nr:diaminopimelate decarboxylase [Propionibacteriales bacterium]
MRAHEAGALHAEAGAGRGPSWLVARPDLNDLVPSLWARNVAKSAAGVLTVAGVAADELATRFGTPLYVIDEEDFRARARQFAAAFAGADVFYAGKAFLSIASVRWIDEEGLKLDVCSGGELAVALRAGIDPAKIGFHGNNKSVPELVKAVEAGVGRIIVDSRVEIERLAAITAERGVRQPLLLRVTAGVEAHTHEYIATAHEDQKFGFSISEGDALDAMLEIGSQRSLDLVGLHSHIGSQIFDTAGFEVAARRVLGLHATGLRHGFALTELDLGGGFGIAYTTQDDPADPKTLAEEINAILTHECAALGIDVPRLSIEPGRAIAGPSTFTLYEVGTVKAVALDAGESRLYVAVDGGMSDNIRTALYDADFSCTLASRRSSAAPVLARVVGKHCESGDIVVKHEFLPADVKGGDLLAVPATGAYCRSLASTYNHVPRAAVVAVAGGDARVIVRRETEDDLLRLEVE